MKKITLLFILSLAMVNWSFSQCTTTSGGNYGNLTMANDGTAEQIAADNWPNAEYSVIEGLIVGNTYTVVGTNTTSIYITVTETPPPPAIAIGTTIVHGASTVSFTATTPDILIFWHLDALCGTQDSDATVTTIQCTSASCSCTAASAPDGAIATIPADGAIDVLIDNSGATPGISFEWTDNGEATSYDFNIVGVGTASGVTNPTTITYPGWAYDTTYSWSITSTNCLGTVTSAEYTFTTGSCTALAAPGATATPGPADMAIDVVLNDNGGNPSLDFSWVEGAGEPSDSFTINIDTVNPPVANSFTNFVNGDSISDLAISTTYFWSVDAVNCFGTTAGPVWSFTTSDLLSTEENKLNLFKVYPNPVKNIITIETALTIDSIDVVNQLGQNVLTLNSNRIINNQVDLSSLSQGLYFMNIRSGDKSESIKTVKD